MTDPIRPWGKSDIARLRRAVDRYPTHTAAAEALGITEEQYAAALDESAEAGETGHIRVNGRRVYAR